MKENNLSDLPDPDFLEEDGNAEWNDDQFDPDADHLSDDGEFDHEIGEAAAQGVDDAERELTTEEKENFISEVNVLSSHNYVNSTVDPLENAEVPAVGIDMQNLRDARAIVEERASEMPEGKQSLIAKRMSLAMYIFRYPPNFSGEVYLPWNVLNAILYGTDFVKLGKELKSNEDRPVTIHFPVDLPEKTKKHLEKAAEVLLSMPDSTFWKNLAISTRMIGLTPLDGAMFLNVLIGMFGLKKPFIWDSGMDRFKYIYSLMEIIHDSKQGDKLYNFFTKIISFKYKGEPIPRSVSATLARDAFCLLYVEIVKKKKQS